MYGLLVADSSRQQSLARTRLEVIRQLAAVDRSYWRLSAAQRAVEVRVQQWELAQAQAERAQRLSRAGNVADIEVVRAQSGVADRVEQIIVAQNTVLLRQRELKQIVNIPGLDVDTGVAIMPVTEPDPVRYVYDAPALADAAVESRMEMLELELQLAQDAARVAFERNSALPLLAMQYTYRINGLGGTEGEAFNSLAENNFEDWSVGLSAEIPLGNEQARSRVAQAVLGRLQRLATRDARRQAIRKEVYDALDQLETSWQRILASRQSVLLRARALEAEQRQFEVGRSTSNDVLDADAALAEARLGEVSALADYQIAQVDLAFATGTLLGAAKVEWAPADPRGGGRDTESISAYHPFSGVLPGSLIGSDGTPTPRPRPEGGTARPAAAADGGEPRPSTSGGTAGPGGVLVEPLP
jgi:outer membrane protein TolC